METETVEKSYLPLTEATFFILLSLASGPRHGYAIMKDVHQMSRGRITFSTGTLYGALKRLLELGWIIRNETGDAGDDETGRPRKDYELTAYGRTVFNSEVNRMKDLVQLAVTIQPEEA